MSTDTSPTITAPSSTEKLPSENKAELPLYATRQLGDPEFKVYLTNDDDPQNLPEFRKWLTVAVIASGALLATCASSIAAFTEAPIQQEFNINTSMDIFANMSIYVLGCAVGPLFVGPLSEVYGRNIIYQLSYIFFFIFSWPVAFAPNIAVYSVFRFFTGCVGAVFLTVAGGTVSDLFSKDKVASPMALYTLSPFLGPVLGPLFGGFINQHLYWRWTYHLITAWSFGQVIALLTLVPETFAPVIIKRKAAKLRKQTGNLKFWTEYDDADKNIGQEILVSLYTPFQLLLLDRMALLLSTWTALLLGILYLAFQAFPIIFMGLHGFSIEMTGLSFIGIGVGMICACASQPLWNRRLAKVMEKYDNNPPPEVHLDVGKVGGILVAISLYWIAFTSYPQVHWIAPIIASAPFGAGAYYVYTSVFTYLVSAYRPVAASAMCANNALRSVFGAAFPLFAGAMYSKLGPVGAMALLGGLATLMVPMPFVFSKIGARLRAKSRFAA